MHAFHSCRQLFATIEIAAETDGFLAAQIEKMLHMGNKCVYGGLTYEIEIEIDPHHAAAVADGAELVICQIAAMGTNSAGVGVVATIAPSPISTKSQKPRSERWDTSG